MFYALLLAGVLMFGQTSTVVAQEELTIRDGVYAGEISLGGMTAEEATLRIEEYIDALRTTEITLMAANDTPVEVTAGDLGLFHANAELVEEALRLGNKGNVIERYKALKTMENEGIVLPVEIDFDWEEIGKTLIDTCTMYDVDPQDVTLRREGGSFQITGGQMGLAVKVPESTDVVYEHMAREWDRAPAVIELVIEETAYQGSAEELAKVQDVLGSFTTGYQTSAAARSGNVENGCRLIDGVVLYPGEEFSALELVTPFTESNGYFPAGSYLNGQVVDSLGGGICQVTTTLYNAALLAELEITQRYNHSMTVGYVDLSADAAIAESAGKDFKFVNNTDAPIYIEGITKNRNIIFNIYGKETRNPNRHVSYESVMVETIEKGPDSIVAKADQPLGYFKLHSGYTGYKSQLWKVVTENGQEVSRTRVNSSNYKMVNTVAEVGVATENADAYNEIMAAIGTANIAHVQNVIGQLTAVHTPQ